MALLRMVLLISSFRYSPICPKRFRAENSETCLSFVFSFLEISSYTRRICNLRLIINSTQNSTANTKNVHHEKILSPMASPMKSNVLSKMWFGRMKIGRKNEP